MNLLLNRLLKLVKLHVHAKFHEAKCSVSRIIVVTEKKLGNDAKNISLLSLFPLVRPTRSVPYVRKTLELWSVGHHGLSAESSLPGDRKKCRNVRRQCPAVFA